MAQARQCSGSQPPTPHPTPSSDHPDHSATGWGGRTAQNVTGVAKQSIGRGARVSEPDYVSFGSRSLSASARGGAGRLRDRKATDGTPEHTGLKAYKPRYIHIDVKYPPHMANETSRGYLFVTIDRGPTGGSSLPCIATRQPPMPGAF